MSSFSLWESKTEGGSLIRLTNLHQCSNFIQEDICNRRGKVSCLYCKNYCMWNATTLYFVFLSNHVCYPMTAFYFSMLSQLCIYIFSLRRDEPTVHIRLVLLVTVMTDVKSSTVSTLTMTGNRKEFTHCKGSMTCGSSAHHRVPLLQSKLSSDSGHTCFLLPMASYSNASSTNTDTHTPCINCDETFSFYIFFFFFTIS